MKFKQEGFRCYEGHTHLKARWAQQCDERHWADRAREFGLDPNHQLNTLPTPPVMEQLEAFPQFTERKAKDGPAVQS